MIELWRWWYKYEFDGYVQSMDYLYDCNPNDIRAYRESGVTNNIQQLISEINGWWYSINYQAINNHTTNKINELKEKIDELPDYTEKINEIDSHNKIAKEEIIDKINNVKYDLSSTEKELKEDNVATRQLLRQKSKKIDENLSKLVDRQEEIIETIEDEANEIEERLEEIYKQEADMIESELEDQYKKEADDIESEIKPN